MEVEVGDFTHAPVWVQLPELPLKYWGQGCLEKLFGLVGNPIKPDLATQRKILLMLDTLLTWN